MTSRTTRQRIAVLRVLTGCQDFVSAQELHTLLTAADVSVGLTTVYRALRDLEATGGVDVVRDDTGERLYRRRPADGHRHYLICRCCGRSRPVNSEAVERWADGIGADTGFTAVEHAVELTGICADCQPAADTGEPPPCRWDPDRGRAHRCAS
ncbi:Fur family transcriptional regulator [Streptomyces malaysiensis]|uniref:Transcriptional repressor n=1 Tax=Streptomyces malaysiensis subsp. samsunensis TaxID=459658 RepID=A0A9X2RYW4_STRMQ|nr:transcriptional repressor [Streptomyces samsunensis]MCQ8835782.1 transcriptional repressor [Streptomyces samsunensis]